MIAAESGDPRQRPISSPHLHPARRQLDCFRRRKSLPESYLHCEPSDKVASYSQCPTAGPCRRRRSPIDLPDRESHTCNSFLCPIRRSVRSTAARWSRDPHTLKRCGRSSVCFSKPTTARVNVPRENRIRLNHSPGAATSKQHYCDPIVAQPSGPNSATFHRDTAPSLSTA